MTAWENQSLVVVAENVAVIRPSASVARELSQLEVTVVRSRATVSLLPVASGFPLAILVADWWNVAGPGDPFLTLTRVNSLIP